MPSTTAVRSGRSKLTVRLSSHLHEVAQEAVRLGLAANQNAFIEDAIRMREREIRLARMREMAREAMSDPGFVADMRGTMAAFCVADAERWPEPD